MFPTPTQSRCSFGTEFPENSWLKSVHERIIEYVGILLTNDIFTLTKSNLMPSLDYIKSVIHIAASLVEF